MMMTASFLDGRARFLGYAGLLPQIFAVLLLSDEGLRWTALAAGFGYAAFIFSFLGGVWWGLGISNPQAPRWIYGAAVLPSLIALAAYLPWIFGWSWPGPSLAVMSACLLLSPLVDREIALTLSLPQGWLVLRRNLSLGLGVLTAVLAATTFIIQP
jgi:hypothetical protein